MTRALAALKERMQERAADLEEMGQKANGIENKRRLLGKAEGVRLAVSYVEDQIKFGWGVKPIGVEELDAQRIWSAKTFGPGPRTEGIIDHITKELEEIRQAPQDISEWIDVVILALDGAWRAGADPEQILTAIHAKWEKNRNRKWPDWRDFPDGVAIEHDRTAD